MGSCRTDIGPRIYYLADWGYVTNATGIAPDREIWHAIQTKRPLVTGVAATSEWDHYDKRYIPNWEQDFPNGLFKGTPNNELKHTDVNHEVLIVGWDDAQGAWLVKNSWEPGCGDHGFI